MLTISLTLLLQKIRWVFHCFESLSIVICLIYCTCSHWQNLQQAHIHKMMYEWRTKALHFAIYYLFKCLEYFTDDLVFCRFILINQRYLKKENWNLTQIDGKVVRFLSTTFNPFPFNKINSIDKWIFQLFNENPVEFLIEKVIFNVLSFEVVHNIYICILLIWNQYPLQ